MPKIKVFDRVATGVLGAIIGGIVGFAISWLLGVYSNTLGPSHAAVDFIHLVLYAAVFFGLVGFVFGPVVGTMLGSVIAAIYHFEGGPTEERSFSLQFPKERAFSLDIPTWFVVVTVVGIVVAVWWWFA
jgi:hypothetical protein